MSEVKEGLLLWWSRNSHCGVIGETATQQRFFVHQSRIVFGPAIPAVDSRVTFEVDSHPPAPGKLPTAINVRVLPAQSAGASALQAEKVEPKAAL